MRDHDCKDADGQTLGKGEDVHPAKENLPTINENHMKANLPNIEENHAKERLDVSPNILQITTENIHRIKETWNNSPNTDGSQVTENIPNIHESNLKETLDNSPTKDDLSQLETTNNIVKEEIWENPPTIEDLAQIEALKNVHLKKMQSVETYDATSLFSSLKKERSSENKEQENNRERSRAHRVQYKKQPLVSCSKCEKSFRGERIWELENHLRRHSFACSHCGKLLKNERALERHVRLHVRLRML